MTHSFQPAAIQYATHQAVLSPSSRPPTYSELSGLTQPTASSVSLNPLPDDLSSADRVEHSYAPSAIRYASWDKAVNFFQDPPDADGLMGRLRYGGRFMSHENDTIDERDTRYKGRANYKGVLYDFSGATHVLKKTRSRIFLAALFIRDRMKRLVDGAYDGIPGIRELYRANLTVTSRTFNDLAEDLKATPGLQRISTEALVALYFQIVNAKRCLDAYLAQPKARSFKRTKMFEIAEHLVGFDDKIQAAKAEWRASLSSEDNYDSDIIDPRKGHGAEVSCRSSCDERSPSLSIADAAPAPQPNQRLNTSSLTVALSSTVPALFTTLSTPAPCSPPGPIFPSPSDLSGVASGEMERELPRMRNDQADMQAIYRAQNDDMLARINAQHEDVLARIKAKQDGMLERIKKQLEEVQARNNVQADMMALIRSQQSAIETLQGRLDALEGDLSKSKGHQGQLEQRVAKLTERCNDQQELISRLDIGLEGTTSRTIKHDIQLRGLESRLA